ncbi:MAG: hypothetical protein ACOYXC_16690 [Candidatus Rifleibacteriota bacterium]
MLRCVTSFFKNSKALFAITLLAFIGAGFSYETRALAQLKTEKESVKSKKSSDKEKKKSEKKEKTDEAKKGSDELFLKEEEANTRFMPDIFRCPECGYEQDEPGFCPDHDKIELTKVLSRGRDPLEPTELDGNEDILVDVPLKNLEFRKEVNLEVASETEPVGKSEK